MRKPLFGQAVREWIDERCVGNLFTRVKHYVQECAFSQENRVKTRQWEGCERVGKQLFFFFFHFGLVVGVNHTSRKVAWFTYISLLLFVRVCMCVYACLLCLSFKFSFNTYAISRKYFAAGGGRSTRFITSLFRLNLLVRHIYFTLNTFLTMVGKGRGA